MFFFVCSLFHYASHNRKIFNYIAIKNSRKYTIIENTLYFKNTHFLDIATLQIGKEKTHYLHTFGPYEHDYLATYR